MPRILCRAAPARRAVGAGLAPPGSRIKISRPAAEEWAGEDRVLTVAGTELQTYFPVAITLLEPGSIVPCEIWLRHEDNRPPVLYRARNVAFTAEHRERLVRSGVETLWVPFSDSAQWTTYLEARLHDRIADPARPVEERAEVLITTSRSIMKEVVTNPRAEGTKKRITGLADSVCELMREPSALAATVRLMEHDYYTYTHCLHVALYSVALARAAGIDDDETLGDIGAGALMHDCGKCMLPSVLINKPGRFSETEWDLMRQHPTFGLQVLEETGWDQPTVKDVVHCHHERCDGSGYPQGLPHRLIPDAARIAAICDAYDAMTTDRAYQRARQGVQALQIIHNSERDKYDKQFTELFIRLLLQRG